MRKKYITLFALILVFTVSIILFTQSTYAVDSVSKPDVGTPSTNTTETDPPAADSTLNLTLEDALKLVETGNSALKLADDKILILEKQNQQALARHNANIPVVDEDTRKDRDLNYKRTQWTLDNAKHDREIQLKDLKAQITNEYQNILTLQKQAENLKTQLGNLEKIIDHVNLQIELGLIVQTEIHTYDAQKSKLEAAKNAIANSIKSSMLTLKQGLGIDINRNVVLTSSLIPYSKFDDSDIDKKIAKAIENSYELSKYEQDIELTQIEYDIAFYYDNMMADQIQLSIEDKKATLASLPTTLEVRFRTAYNNIKTLENTIEADKLTVEADQINISVMQKNIDVGKASSLEMIALQNKLLTDQYTLQQDINAYMTAVTNFQNSLESHFLQETDKK